MTAAESSSSPKEIKPQENLQGGSGAEGGLQEQAAAALSRPGINMPAVQERFGPHQNSISGNGFPNFSDGSFAQNARKASNSDDTTLAFAGEIKGGEKSNPAKPDDADAPSESFELTEKGTDSSGREYLSFKAPPSMAVKDIKYYPKEGKFEMEPRGNLPKPEGARSYASENELPITKVVMDPETGRMDFHLANKGWVGKGYGKTLNFGEQQADRSITFGGTIVNNDGRSFEVKDVTGVAGHHFAVGYKPIESFTMSATKSGYKTVPVIKNEGPRAAEDMSRNEFENLTNNAKNYMDTLGRLRLHINDQGLLAEKR